MRLDFKNLTATLICVLALSVIGGAFLMTTQKARDAMMLGGVLSMFAAFATVLIYNKLKRGKFFPGLTGETRKKFEKQKIKLMLSGGLFAALMVFAVYHTLHEANDMPVAANPLKAAAPLFALVVALISYRYKYGNFEGFFSAPAKKKR